MRVCSGEDRQESTSSCVGIRHHLQQHLVAHGHQGPWFERPTEAAEPLSIEMATINVHIVVAAQVVTLQVDEAE